MILAVLPNWLGDLVMSLPALDHLREKDRVVGVGASSLLELLADDGRLDATVPYDRHGADASLRGLWRVARRCGAHAPRRAVVFVPSLRGAALAVLAGARSRRGYPGEGRRLLLNDARHRDWRPRSEHLADEWLALARDDARLGRGDAVPRYRPGPQAAEGLGLLRERRGDLPEPGTYAVIAPGALYGHTKRWPGHRFVDVAKLLHHRHGWRSVVVGSGELEERKLAEEVARQSGGISTAGDTDLPTLAALLRAAAVFVGNDSGAMHLAAAVGVPTLGIFGSTSPAWTGPRGPMAASVGPFPVDCAPCFLRQCPIGLPCLEQLSVTVVHDAVSELLARPERKATAR